MTRSSLLAIGMVAFLAWQGELLSGGHAPWFAAARACVITPSANFTRDIPCAQEVIDKASLTGTYWRPVEIDGKPMGLAAGQREPHLMLASERTMRGFGGCNQLQGRYELQGNELRFTGTATTRMFCQESMDQEAAFLQAIEATATYAIVGETLELYDRNGRLLARFESNNLR